MAYAIGLLALHAGARVDQKECREMKNTKLAEHKKIIRKCKRILAFLLHIKQTAQTEGRLRDAYLSIVEVLEYIEAEEMEGV